MASRVRNKPTVDKMGRPRRALLELLYARGTARTSELRRDADIPQGSKRYHFDRLRVDPSDDDVDSWGFIHVVDRVPSEFGGSDERVWSLTSAGREYVETTLSVDPTTREEGLSARIERLEEQVRKQQAVIEQYEGSQSEAEQIAREARNDASRALSIREQTKRHIKNKIETLEHDLSAKPDQERIDELEREIQSRDLDRDKIERNFDTIGDNLEHLDGRIEEIREEINEDDEDEPRGFFEETEAWLRQKFGPYW